MKRAVEMDMILELLKEKLTPVVFVSIIVVVLFVSIFNEELKTKLKGLYKSRRTRITSIISSLLIAVILVVAILIDWEWWQQLLLCGLILFFAFIPCILIYNHSIVFLIKYRKYKDKYSKAIELFDEYIGIEKYAKTARDKYLFIYKLFDFCELSNNYKTGYIYYLRFDVSKLTERETHKFNERYGIILINIGSLKNGIDLLKDSNSILSKDRLAFACEMQDNKDKALELMEELKLQAEKSTLTADEKSLIFNDYARIFSASNGVVNALKYYNEALKYAKQSKYHELPSVIYSNIIRTLLEQNEKEQGMVYFNEYINMLSIQKDSVNVSIERCNIKMCVARLTGNPSLAIEAVDEMNQKSGTFPLKEKLNMMAQTLEIKANLKLDITDDILKIIAHKDDINKLDIPLKANVYDHFERVLAQIEVTVGSRFEPFRNMVDWYYTNQMRLDAIQYADEIPSACVFEKNRWLRSKYIFLLRHGDINVTAFKNYYEEIAESYKENGLVWDEIDTKFSFVKEMFYINNVVDTNAFILKSKYQTMAAEQIRAVDEFIISTPYRKKIEGIIFEAFIFSFFCEEYAYVEKLYQILQREHPDNRMINPQINSEFLNVLKIYESRRLVVR